MEVCDFVQDVGIKTILKKKKCKKAKWLSAEDLQIAEKRREAKGKGEKERYTHLNAEFQKIARRDEKAFLIDQCKEIEENHRMGRTRDLFPGGGHGHPLWYSCLENTLDRGAWQAMVHGVTKSWT